MLDLIDRSVVSLEGNFDYFIVFVVFWEYPIDFLVVNPKNKIEGHSLILGITWLATVNTYIGCRTGMITISK